MQRSINVKWGLAGIGIFTLVGLYFFFNPGGYSFFPKCPFYSLTGFYCPGCGSQRAFHALLHGHLLQVAGYNLLAVLCLPFIIYSAMVVIFNTLWNKQWKVRIFYKPWFTKIILCSVLLFWILRNLPYPYFHWLAP